MFDHQGRWISFFSSMKFLLRHIRLVGWSFLLMAVTALLTWFGYHESIRFVDSLTSSFFQASPAGTGVLSWMAEKGRLVLHYPFLLVTRVVAFYLAFLAAYCLTSPGYVFLSGKTERIYRGHKEKQQVRLTFTLVLIDFWEGIKIGVIGVVVTFIALCVNFIPVVGQIFVFVIYTLYSTLMFIDYPASNKRWKLGQKINWIQRHPRRSLRLGLFPALVSMVPIVNIIFMAILFPLFTVHTTLNFISSRSAETDDREFG